MTSLPDSPLDRWQVPDEAVEHGALLAAEMPEHAHADAIVRVGIVGALVWMQDHGWRVEAPDVAPR